MTALERLENLLAGKEIDRPPFMPAIYDLKPAFIGSPSHTFGQEKNEIIDALTFEAEQLITVIDKLLHSLKYYTTFIIGTGILQPGVSVNSLKAAKKYIVNYFK